MRRPACRSRATYSGQRKVQLRCLTPWREAVTPAVSIILGIASVAASSGYDCVIENVQKHSEN